MYSHSLALLAMRTYVHGPGRASLSLGAIWLASRPAARRHTTVFTGRILAALVNGVTLFAICGCIVTKPGSAGLNLSRLRPRDAVGRDPGVAGQRRHPVGLVEAAYARIGRCARPHAQPESARALLHVFGDLLGSVGTIAAAVIVIATGWAKADPLISVIIAVLIVVSALSLLWETLRVLLEIAPGILIGEVGRSCRLSRV